MELEILLGNVFINEVRADLGDKIQFIRDLKSGEVKIKRQYRYNDRIDIDTF